MQTPDAGPRARSSALQLRVTLRSPVIWCVQTARNKLLESVAGARGGRNLLLLLLRAVDSVAAARLLLSEVGGWRQIPQMAQTRWQGR
jgi:hypothetical protein